MAGKTPNVLSAISQPFKTGPLIDQRGFYARYELLMNKPMFEYIVANTLYSKQGQQAFSGTVAFPPGQRDDRYERHHRRHNDQGDLEGDGPQRQPGSNSTRWMSLVYTPPSDDPKVAESCVKQTMGLAGLHIAHKTLNEPQWLWSTLGRPHQQRADAGRRECQEAEAAVQFLQRELQQDGVPGERAAAASVGTRTSSRSPAASRARSRASSRRPRKCSTSNASFQGILKGTVWANYMLISTQWPTNGASKTDPTGLPAPTYLANTTLETYIQGKIPQSSSNCIACHNNATTLHVPATPSDFTYILENAK